MYTYSARRSRPWLHIAFWAAALLAGYLWNGDRLLRTLRPGPNVTVDFFQEWASARFYSDGLPVYSPQDDQAVERYLGQKRGQYSLRLNVNAHPPTSVLLALPFGALPYHNACFVWNLLSLAALAASLFLIARQLELSFSLRAVLPGLTLLLFCQPLYAQLYHGQFNLLLLLLLVGAWAAERSERPWWAGALLGTAAVLKLFPAFLLLPFLLRRRWSVLASAALTGAGWTALTLLVLGVDTYRDYVERVMPHLSVYYTAAGNVSLTAYWRQLFVGMETFARTLPVWYEPLAARLATAASTLAVIAVVAWMVMRARARVEWDHAFALAIAGMLLISPIAWNHYFLMLLLPAAILWKWLPSSGAWRPAFWLCVVLLCLTWHDLYRFGLPIFSRDADGEKIVLPWQAVTFLSMHHYALLGFFALGAFATLRCSGAPRRASVLACPGIRASEDACPTKDAPETLAAPLQAAASNFR
jgi:alpha-1,2-mannosyltransferase